MYVLAIMCFVATATALPVANTVLTNTTDDLSTEKVSTQSIHLPQSLENLNRGNTSSIEESVKPDDPENISKEYHDGRGDAPLDLYEEQQYKEKGSTFQTNQEPTLETDKLQNNITNKFLESQSISNTPIADVLVENTTLSATTEKELKTTSVSTSNSLTKQQALQNQQTTSTPLSPIDIQHKQLKDENVLPTSESPKKIQVMEKQKTYTQKEPVLKSIQQAPSSSQQKGNLQTEHITSTNLPKSDIPLKEDLISVSKPKPPSNLLSSESQQNGQSLKKQEIKSSNRLASGISERGKKAERDGKVSPLFSVFKGQQKEQAAKRKNKTTSPFSVSHQIGQVPATEHIIPLSKYNVLQKERESNTENINSAIFPFETKQIGYVQKQETEAVTPVTVLESQQKVPGREEIFSLPLSDIQEQGDLGERYNCEEDRRYPWFNIPIPPLLYSNEIQGPLPVVLSPMPIFLPYRNSYIFKRPYIKYPTFMVV